MKKLFYFAAMLIVTFVALTSCNKDSTTTAESIFLVEVSIDGNEYDMENEAIGKELDAFVASLQKKYSKEARYTWSGDSKTSATATYTKKFIEDSKVDELRQKLEEKLAEFKTKVEKKAYGSAPYKATIYLSVTRDGEFIYPTSGKKKMLTYTFSYQPEQDVEDEEEDSEE